MGTVENVVVFKLKFLPGGVPGCEELFLQIFWLQGEQLQLQLQHAGLSVLLHFAGGSHGAEHVGHLV